jgi:hypothetical protein
VSYYPDLAIPGAVETVGAFARLAVERGVPRLVLLSGRGEEEAELAEQAVRDSGAELTVPRFDPSSATAPRRLSQMRSRLQITLAATRPHPFGEVSFSSTPARLLPRPAAVAGVFTPSEVAADQVIRGEAPFRTP